MTRHYTRRRKRQRSFLIDSERRLIKGFDLNWTRKCGVVFGDPPPLAVELNDWPPFDLLFWSFLSFVHSRISSGVQNSHNLSRCTDYGFESHTPWKKKNVLNLHKDTHTDSPVNTHTHPQTTTHARVHLQYSALEPNLLLLPVVAKVAAGSGGMAISAVLKWPHQMT